jgi:hypothetical protein
MLSNRIRTALVTAAVAAIGVTSAHAAIKSPGGFDRPTKISGAATSVDIRTSGPGKTVTVSSVARTARGQTIARPIIRNHTVVAEFQAGSTGTGVDQATCDAMANHMNQLAELAMDHYNNGDWPRAVEADGWLEEAENEALDAGCFIIY